MASSTDTVILSNILYPILIAARVAVIVKRIGWAIAKALNCVPRPVIVVEKLSVETVALFTEAVDKATLACSKDNPLLTRN